MRLFLLVSAFATIGWSATGRTEEISVEALFQRPKFGAMRLSPDGAYLAAIVRLQDRNNLEVVDLRTREAKAITGFDYTDVLYFAWINNQRLVLAVGDAEEASGRRRFNGWLAVDRDGSRAQRLRNFTSYLGAAPGGGDGILVTAGWRGTTINDVYLLDTYSHRFKLLTYDYPGEVRKWVVDRNGVPRVAHSYLKGLHTLWYRESADAPWTKIDEGTQFQLHFNPIAFDYDNKTLYVSAIRDGDKRAVYTYDFAANKLGDVVAGSAQVDISSLLFSRSKQALIGAGYQAGKPGVLWFDPEVASLQKTVDEALPNTFNVVRLADRNAPRRGLRLFRRELRNDLPLRYG